ncbi:MULTISPECIES: TetR family transcriptional regulator [unclassified Streptomyces]|uniref:TetR/AcrR family transcriptional regulator n=1 Tax=unclassified Streptomyces TaxID=2593676 RepID=UPI00070E61FE|nr:MULTISPECIES: TetR family transcriptional regulator [unclassified Streptomyces]KRD23549.1 transcriptional regulator [Streptomyces sp. Root264]
MNKSRGRPRGGSDAKERILAAAKTAFLRHGYHATTMRAVASAAGVDPALISYHFGSKQGLFGGAMALGISPGQVMARVLEGDPGQMPEQIVRAVLDVWDDPEFGGPLTLLVTQAQRDPALMRAFREYVERELTARLAERIGGADAAERAGAVLTTTLGLIFSRYVLRLNPMAAMDSERVVGLLAPGLGALLRPARAADE